MSFRKNVQHKYALSEQGAREMIKAFISVTISDIVLMFPVGLLYYSGIRLHERYPKRSGTVLHHRKYHLSGSDCGHNLYPIQYHVPFHICGKWSKTCDAG